MALVEVGQRVPTWALVVFVVVFVIVNAATEEVAYRGIAFEAAAHAFPAIGAIVGQAIAFGTLHVSGFPSGAMGVVLTFSYGLSLGVIRHLTGGIKFPVLAHMTADATIAILVIVLLLGR
jgi:membrane protease YdiL (CAAX protease family)